MLGEDPRARADIGDGGVPVAPLGDSQFEQVLGGGPLREESGDKRSNDRPGP